MENVLDFLRTDAFLIILAGINVILIIFFLINTIKVGKIKKEYKGFMKKLGKGENLEDMLKEYISKVEEVAIKNKEIEKRNKKLGLELQKCIKKVGIVRYSAFQDTGSDLSFALALLDEKNSGVVLNGIYSREISNIYAKPVEDMKSEYTLSEEETKAIDIAVKNS